MRPPHPASPPAAPGALLSAPASAASRHSPRPFPVRGTARKVNPERHLRANPPRPSASGSKGSRLPSGGSSARLPTAPPTVVPAHRSAKHATRRFHRDFFAAASEATILAAIAQDPAACTTCCASVPRRRHPLRRRRRASRSASIRLSGCRARAGAATDARQVNATAGIRVARQMSLFEKTAILTVGPPCHGKTASSCYTRSGKHSVSHGFNRVSGVVSTALQSLAEPAKSSGTARENSAYSADSV